MVYYIFSSFLVFLSSVESIVFFFFHFRNSPGSGDTINCWVGMCNWSLKSLAHVPDHVQLHFEALP